MKKHGRQPRRAAVVCIPCGADGQGDGRGRPLRFAPARNDKELSGNMNWEVILWTCITVAVLIGFGTLVISIISARNMRKSRDRMAQLQGEIKVGARVLFGGGIYGTITGIQDDVIRVEVSKGVVLEISRYSIQTVA